MKAVHRAILMLAAIAISALPAFAQKYPPEVQRALTAVQKHVESLENGRGGEIKPQQSAAVRAAFPDYTFVVVRYRVFPVARIMPKGMKPSNLFVADKEGKNLLYLNDQKALEKFFRSHEPTVKGEKQAKLVLAAWLALTPEFHQDGFYSFEILDKEFAADATKASGRVIAMKGGNGDIKADLTFDQAGKLAKVEEKVALRPGPRPICQATKLLDADPIVRRMAEQDLLIMGLAARDYLAEQRTKASPELRQAIDRIWLQIQQNGW